MSAQCSRERVQWLHDEHMQWLGFAWSRRRHEEGGATESIGHETDSGGKAGETFFDVLGYNPGMSERDEKRGGAGCAIVGLVLAFVFLPVLYVLGLGPAVWLANQYPAARDVLGLVYSPLEFVHDNFETVGVWLDRYVELWE